MSEIYARTADELLPPPVFPTSDLSIPVGQLPPSLPFTDPVIPDMHPIPYLFSLHRLSMERAHQQLAIRLFHAHQLASAKRLYDAEVERIEDEYEAATKGVVERLVDGVEERRKRLLEEKEGEGVTIGAFTPSCPFLTSLDVCFLLTLTLPFQTLSWKPSELTARGGCEATAAAAEVRPARTPATVRTAPRLLPSRC